MSRELNFDSNKQEALAGNLDTNIKIIEKELDVKLDIKSDKIVIASGNEENEAMAERLIKALSSLIDTQKSLSKEDIYYSINLVKKSKEHQLYDIQKDVVAITSEGKTIRPKTIGQKRYVDMIRKSGITFGIGPAGTGKTYLAIAMAVNAFKNKEVSKIILTRPAVEAGENLGFLPGDLKEKVDPYLRPVYDALYEIMGKEQYEKNAERGLIEVAPLAYMRGRTLDKAFIILDEAQNTTEEQMKMFLTRMGFNSKVIVTGDITQRDLPKGKKSGLIAASHILRNINGISFIELTQTDVVRNILVQRIIEAYNAYESKKLDKESKEREEKDGHSDK